MPALMRCLGQWLFCLALAATCGRARADSALGRFAVVQAAPGSTSVYVAVVSLSATPFVRHGTRYLARYRADVFPFFFYDERGRLIVDVSDAQLRALAVGRPIDFTGRAIRSDGAVRRIDGRVTPAGPDRGAIKVRIHVGRRITLVFNTTYRLPGAERIRPSPARTPSGP
ncbi:MAG: hypothetical protein ACREFX_02540 [Opitutaceae bacterium]